MTTTLTTSIPAAVGAQPGLLQLGGFGFAAASSPTPIVVLTAGQANPTSKAGEVAPDAG